MSHTSTYRSDDELLEGLRRHSPGAPEAFFDRFAEPVYGFGLKIHGRDEDARALLQETLLTALSSLKDVKHAKAIPRWLFRVAAQACLARAKKGPAGESRELPIEELMPERKDGKPVPIQDWSLDPDEESRRQEEKLLLKEVVAELPMAYRLVLILHDMEEMTDNDAAEIVGAPVQTIRTRLHRARLFVRKALGARLAQGGQPGSLKAS